MNQKPEPNILKKKAASPLGNVHPAVLAIWAALIATARILPSIPMIGTGSTFSLSSALIPLAGIFFGPIPGAICAGVGGFIGQLMAPHTAWLGLATFLIGTLNALAAGFVSRGKWPVSIGIIGLGTLLFYSTEIGREAFIFPIVFYGLGAVMAVFGGIFGKKWLLCGKAPLKAIAIFLCSFAGAVSGSSLANMASVYLFELPAENWILLAGVAPLERTVFSVGAALVGTPLLMLLPKIGVHIGPQLPLPAEEAPPPVDDVIIPKDMAE